MFRHRCTRIRSATANTNREMLVNPLRGRTTVSRAEMSTDMASTVPSRREPTWRRVTPLLRGRRRVGRRRCRVRSLREDQVAAAPHEPEADGQPEGDDDLVLSLIHISEPTRRTPIAYAVFC